MCQKTNKEKTNAANTLTFTSTIITSEGEYSYILLFNLCVHNVMTNTVKKVI